MKTVPALLLALACAGQSIACDKVGAANVQAAFTDAGTQWSERGGVVTLDWGRVWEGTAAAQRMEMLRSFAEGDACLAGGAREISFYHHGKLVGRASPAGIQLLDAAPPRRTPAC